MTDHTHLLLIDPQNDFCDIPGAALPVPGAMEDMNRLTLLVARLNTQLDAITVTLDSHSPIDIAHPKWWQNEAGVHPEPFTLISEQDVIDGIWRASDPDQQETSLQYVHKLVAGGRYQLIVWPEHCLIGSWGHAVENNLFNMLNRWSRVTLKPVEYLFKGQHPSTEHYSAIRAEVPDPEVSITQTNTKLLDQLASADTLLIAGQALSHCVACTVRDIADYMLQDQLYKLIVLTDCCSPVSGYEKEAELFIAEMRERGVRCLRSIEI